MSKAQTSSLIQCPDCGKEHSRLAVACPNCARPNPQEQSPEQRSVFDKDLGPGGVVYLIMILVGLSACFLKGYEIVGGVLLAIGGILLFMRIAK